MTVEKLNKHLKTYLILQCCHFFIIEVEKNLKKTSKQFHLNEY